MCSPFKTRAWFAAPPRASAWLCTLSSQSMRSMALCLAFSTLASSSVKAVSATSAGSGTWRKRKVDAGLRRHTALLNLLVRAGQDRRLADGSHLFAKTGMLPEAGRMAIDLPAAPGRRARTAIVSLRFCKVEIARPKHRTSGARAALPRAVALSLVEASEINPPAGVDGAHWRLLTTHAVNDVADARRIVDFYRQRWTIEQLFRTLKTQGFNVEALRQAEGGPFERLVAASLIAAVTVLQLVRERDGVAKRPLEDAFDPEDRPALEAISADLEGKTTKQKKSHPKGSLAFAAWVFARLGGWNGYYGKPGPVVMLHGLTRFQAIKHGWALRNV